MVTNKEILKLAIKVGFSLDKDDGTWFCLDEELLKFAQEIRKQTIDEILTTLEEVPNPEANRTAINRIKGI